MFVQALLNLSLPFALAAGVLLMDPKQDPDVQPHLERGYFMQTESAKPSSSITEARAKKIADDFLKHFEHRLSERGLQFKVVVDWQNNWFSAHARFEEKTSSAILWGGFLRAPGMTDTIIATTLCHELGHLIGGAPYQTITASNNFSTEGQSDFFAGACLAEFAQKHPEYFTSISPDVRSYCVNKKNCMVALEGGLQTVRFMQKWGFEIYKPVSIRTSEKSAAQFIANTYPSNQCRLDSFIRRAECLRDGQEACTPPPCWWPLVLKYPPTL